MYCLGWIPDDPDPRDRHLVSLGLSEATPPSASIQNLVTDILDQRSTSKCVAHAFAQALRIEDRVRGVVNPQLSARDFLYYNALAYGGTGFIDQGTQLRDCVKGLTRFGRPPESACPFSEDPLVARPNWEAYREGFDFAGPSGYYRVLGADQIKQAIAARKPVCGGAQVGQSIMDYTGGIYDPTPGEPSIGGHALCFVAYDAADNFTIVNSWGAAYGEGGFLRVSRRWVEAAFSDCWAVQL